MRQLSELNIIEHCDQCIHQLKDEYNPYRKYCGKFIEIYGEPKEISVIHDFPVICPLPRV